MLRIVVEENKNDNFERKTDNSFCSFNLSLTQLGKQLETTRKSKRVEA